MSEENKENNQEKQESLNEEVVRNAEAGNQDELEIVVEQLRNEAKENYDKYLRALADLENFKKRSIKERADSLKYAGESLAREILEPIDDLERAINQDTSGSLEEFVKGIKMIHERFIAALGKFEISGEDTIGKTFDPSKMEALASIPSEDKEPGIVLEQFRKFYMFKDKLLRPAQVVVSIANTTNEKSENETN